MTEYTFRSGDDSWRLRWLMLKAVFSRDPMSHFKVQVDHAEVERLAREACDRNFERIANAISRQRG